MYLLNLYKTLDTNNNIVKLVYGSSDSIPRCKTNKPYRLILGYQSHSLDITDSYYNAAVPFNGCIIRMLQCDNVILSFSRFQLGI